MENRIKEWPRRTLRRPHRWPRTRILLRADSGFCRDALMAWCEAHRVDFVFGLARNARLVDAIGVELTGLLVRPLLPPEWRNPSRKKRAEFQELSDEEIVVLQEGIAESRQDKEPGFAH